MAEAAVSFLQKKLSEHFKGEEQLPRGVHDDANYIMDELEFMKAFLRVADAREDSDPRLKVMVKKVREVAYEMEDALDDFRLCLARNPRNGNGKFASAMELAFAVKTLGARHRIASQLRSIKGRVQSLGQQQLRYSDQNSELMRPGLTSTNAKSASWPVADPHDSDLVGIDDRKANLRALLLGDETVRYVVSVVGMGGLGKSTLSRMVYDDPVIKDQFRFRAWITISPSYKIEGLLKDVIRQLFKEVKRDEPKGLDNMDYTMLREKIHSLLKQRRYLIVLDDVWDTNVWEEFMEFLPNDSSRSRVLLTTRKESIAFHSCYGALGKVYVLTPLSAEDSKTLFERKLFRNDPCPPNLREVTAKLLRRCEGLPLAIVAITGVLSSKDICQQKEWEMVDNSLGYELESNDNLGNLKNILCLSYKDLPYYLKSCLLYLSIFPLGNTIERMRIIRLWVAEGFVKEREGMTLEEVAHSYLNGLIKRNLVKVVKMTNDGRIKTYHIHDILREILISKAKDQVFAAIVKDQDRIWPEKVRRLSIHEASTSIQQRQIGSGSQLRSLLMFLGMDQTPESRSPLLNLLRPLKLLTVLDLEGTSIDEFPKEITRLLLLKYLSLRRTRVESIPRSIGNLKVLETLDLKHARVTELPAEIQKLQKLRHLLVYRYNFEVSIRMNDKSGFKSPAEIGNLESMQKLCYVEANSKMVVELRRLLQLRRLGIIKLQEADGPALCSSIENLTNLLALSVTAIDGEEIIDMVQLSCPPPLLQRLYLNGRLEKLPNWIFTARNLVKMILRWSRLGDDPLHDLQHLPNLMHLEMMQTYEGDRMSVQAKGFQKLKFLGLNGIEKLRIIQLEKGAMPFLGKIILQDCPSLERLPLGIENLGELKVLDLFDMSERLVRRLQYNGEDQNLIRHVPEVYLTSWNHDHWDAVSLAASPEKGSNPVQRDAYLWKA